MACTTCSCLASVVRMKSSYEMLSVFHISLYLADTSSVHALGETPLAAADFSMLAPCSSVPVKNRTSKPFWRL